jgi:hypothetical protein
MAKQQIKQGKEIKLRNGVTATIMEFNGAKVEEAQNLAATVKGVSFLTAVINVTVLFDGKQLPFEEIKNLHGMDYLKLQSEILGDDVK